MADNVQTWTEVLSAIFSYPEKGALILVLLAGAWRWIREIWREKKDDDVHESLVEMLMKENRQLREELVKKSIHPSYNHHQSENDHKEDHKS